MEPGCGLATPGYINHDHYNHPSSLINKSTNE